VNRIATNSISTRELTSGALRHVGPLRLPVAAMPQGLHLGCSQPTLRFIEMPAVDVLIPDEVNRISIPLRLELPNWYFRARELELECRKVSVTPIQKHLFETSERL